MLLGSPKEHLRQTHKSVPTWLCKYSFGKAKNLQELMDRNGGRARRRFIFFNILWEYKGLASSSFAETRSELVLFMKTRFDASVFCNYE